jgi:hypothetical protein
MRELCSRKNIVLKEIMMNAFSNLRVHHPHKKY